MWEDQAALLATHLHLVLCGCPHLLELRMGVKEGTVYDANSKKGFAGSAQRDLQGPLLSLSSAAAPCRYCDLMPSCTYPFIHSFLLYLLKLGLKLLLLYMPLPLPRPNHWPGGQAQAAERLQRIQERAGAGGKGGKGTKATSDRQVGVTV